MAKRSYVAPHRIPRPGLDDSARDVLALVDTLARRGVIRDERDLVIAGYSEGSLVAAKVFGLMRRPPAAGILLGSATGAVDYARGVFDRLRAAGRGDVTFRVIEYEVHQFQRYDVFLVLDAWISSGGRTADFVPSPEDRAAMDRASAVASLLQSVSALPFAGEPEKAAAAFTEAGRIGLEDARAWFKLGMLLADGRRLDEALAAFEAALAHGHDAPHAVMTWAGHVCDLKGNRPAALEWYRQALAADNGMPMRHDHLGITIDRAWIERRLSEAYSGPAKAPAR